MGNHADDGKGESKNLRLPSLLEMGIEDPQELRG